MVATRTHGNGPVSLRGDGTGLRSLEIDNTLLRRAGGGDRDAFAALYERHAGAVYGLACRLLHSPSLAEGVTQDVFLAVWAQAPAFDSSRGSARTWILTLAHRRAVDAVRRGGPLGPRPDSIPADPWAADERLSLAIGSLDEPERTAIQLAYLGGLTSAQVAEQLRLPVPTAKARIRDGLRRLASELSSGMSTPADLPS